MNIVFVSNYYNHHQSALSDALNKETKGQFVFIQTMPMESERINMGWSTDLQEYVINSYTDKKSYDKCMQLINNADVVITGSAPEKMIRTRIRENKLTFRYSERIYKNRRKLLQLPLRFIKYHWNNAFSTNTYMLCASAYAAGDYAKTGSFINKTYKWGYFPEVKRYDDIDQLLASKKRASILWVGRLIEWKHPDAAIEIARQLKEEGFSFCLNIIGNGILEDKLKKMIKDYNLCDCVHMLGAMKPEKVREYMERSEIFLFTSDRNEGWGAVLNEAMNSACAVVASHAIGSVPFLIENGKNGYIYKSEDLDSLYTTVKWMLEHHDERKTISENAYDTLVNEWNAENASKKFLYLAKKILNGVENPDVYKNGVCSKAEISKNDWYKKTQI